ncbi:MAG: c-type cytochrome [Gammaproteobacteria bacterium]
MVHADKEFMKYFMVVLGVLVGMAFIFFFIARSFAPDYSRVGGLGNTVAKRIEPVGQVNTAAVTEQPVQPAAQEPVVEATAESGGKGKEVYGGACFACHDQGVANAPKLGDKEAWGTRLEQGTGTLYTSALNGKGTMPAKGGRVDLSDDDIKAAVDYMLSQAQ